MHDLHHTEFIQALLSDVKVWLRLDGRGGGRVWVDGTQCLNKWHPDPTPQPPQMEFCAYGNRRHADSTHFSGMGDKCLEIELRYSQL